MKCNRHNRIEIVCLLVMLAGSVFCAFAKKTDPDQEADRRKASYAYVEAVNAFMAENYNLYGELLTRAYNLDPSDPELQSRFGEWLLMTAANDSATVERGFRMMIDAYDKKEPDYFEGMQLINLASNYRRWSDLINISEKVHEQFPNRQEVRHQLGRSYMMRVMLGDTSYVKRAIDTFSSLEQSLGKSPQLTEYKIRTFAIVGDTASIIHELSDLSAASPADPYAALTIAQVYNSLSKPDSALVYFNRACEIDSTNGDAIMMRAQFYRQQGDSITYDSEAFRAIESRDLELETKLKLIVNYVNALYNDSTQQSRIDNLFDILLDVNPGEAEVHRLYAEYFGHTNRLDKAAEQMEYAVDLDGSDRSNWLYLSNILYSNGDYEKAANALQRAEAKLGTDQRMTFTRAMFLTLAEKYEDAIEVLEAIPDSTLTDPEQISSFNSLLGDAYYKTHQRAKAFRAYKKSLDANPTNYMSMNNIAYYYAESDTLLDEAESYVLRALRHDADNPTTLDTYAWVLYKKGDYPKAKEIIDKTLSLMNYYNDADSIDASIERIVEENKKSATDIIEEAAAAIRQENQAEAKEIAAEVKEKENVGSAEVLDHAGDIYFRNGDIVQAVEFWKEALKREPDKPEIIKAKIKQRKITDK